MKHISILAMLAALGLSPLAAIGQTDESAEAQMAGDGPLPSFATLDADGSGDVTLEEVEAALLARFAAADTDASGTLDADELAAAMTAMMDARHAMAAEAGAGRMADRMAAEMAYRLPEMTARMITRMDRDGDGLLGATEMRPPNLAEMFARVDTDDNGSISEWEYDQMIAQHGAGKGGRNGHRGGHGAGYDSGRDSSRDSGRGGHRGHGDGWFNWGRGH